MDDFRATLDQFLAGILSYDALLQGLHEHLEARPGEVEEVDGLLRDLLRQDRIPVQIYTGLMGELAAARALGSAAARQSIGKSNSQSEAPVSSANPTQAATVLRPQTVPPDSGASQVGAGTVLKQRFVLEKELGRGGMGVVFKALDLRKEEARDREPYVAIKVLNEEFKDTPEAFVILQRETKKTQSLAHPNIGTVYDFDRDGSIFYMCMELLSGESLDQVLKRNGDVGLSFREAKPIIADMASGLAYAHKSGFVHADFKPSNVFITANGEVKVFDFGIARAITAPGQTAHDTVFDPGKWEALTPSYASCEMIDGLAADPRDDVYALACVTYQLLSGRHPFDKKPANQARAAGLKPHPLKELTRVQNQALARGLAFSRRERTPGVTEFLTELTSQRSRINWPVWLTAGTAAFLAVGLLVVLLIGPDPPEPQPQETGSDPVVLELDPETQARISSILQVADAHLSIDRLVEPPGSNAAEAYRAVLELQPGHPEALAGLDKVATRIVTLARDRLARGSIEDADSLVNQGRAFLPDHQGLRALQREIRLQNTDGRGHETDL